MTMTARDWGMMILLSVLWGGSFFFVGVAIQDMHPLTMVLARVALGAAAMFAWLRATGQAVPCGRAALIAFLGMGLLNNFVPYSLLFWAQTHIPSGLAAITNATTPIFSIIVAQIFLKDEKIAANKVAGIVLGIAGVAVLVGGSAISGETGAVLGIGACILAAVSYGLATVFGRRFRAMNMSPAVVTFGQLAASSLMMAPVALLVDRPWTQALPGGHALAAILALALLSTAFAYILYFRLLASAGAVNVSLVTLLIPPSAILLGTLFLGEHLAIRHYLGMVLIGLGLLAIDGRPFAMLRRRLGLAT